MSIRGLLGKIDYFTRPFKPQLLLNIIKSKLCRQVNKLDTLDISVGFTCNMRCKHCSAQAMVSDDRVVLTLDDYKKLSTELNWLNVFRINITGGEPLLYPIEEIMAAINPKARHIKIQTNGLLLNNDRILSLKKAGANAISMSLDSVNADEFNEFRGVRGSFDKVIDNIGLIRWHGLQVSLAAVVTHQSLRSGEAEKMIHFAEKHKCHLLFNIAIAVGRWSGHDEFLFDAKGNDRAKLNRLLKQHSHVHTDHDSSGCPAGTRKIYLTPYGDIIPCPFIHVSFGNIKDKKLRDIRSKILMYYAYSGMPYCPAAESVDLYESWLKKVSAAVKLPIDYSQIVEEQ